MTKIKSSKTIPGDDKETSCNNKTTNHNRGGSDFGEGKSSSSPETPTFLPKQNSRKQTSGDGQANDDDSYSLRPKFAIFKHKTEVLRQQTTNKKSNEQRATTPSWFFNIPTTRSPFPDFRG